MIHRPAVPVRPVVSVALGLLLASCGGDKSTNPTGTIPAAVTNLAATSTAEHTMTLTWTAPGFGGSGGTAGAYDVRYSIAAIDDDTAWASATPATGEPAPKAAGGAETFTVTGLQRAATYHFALKSRGAGEDDWSGLSNDATGTTRNAPLGFVLVAADTFSMGSPAFEDSRGTDEVRHLVTLTRSFQLSDHEVTQGEWQSLMGWNESNFIGDASRPVENVTWFDAVAFCNARSAADGLAPAYTISGETKTGNHLTAATVDWALAADGYRLPTEAEWEFACRAGSTGPFNRGACLSSLYDANYDGNYPYVSCATGPDRGTTMPVKNLSRNAWGLYDMHGNVAEWCWDWYGAYDDPATDPIGAAWSHSRVVRGGSWFDYANWCRSAFRYVTYARDHNSAIGLRLARTAP